MRPRGSPQPGDPSDNLERRDRTFNPPIESGSMAYVNSLCWSMLKV
jgi:hypothetical protein